MGEFLITAPQNKAKIRVAAPKINHEYLHPSAPKIVSNFGTRNPVNINPNPLPDAIMPAARPLFFAENHAAGSIIAGTFAPPDPIPVKLLKISA